MDEVIFRGEETPVKLPDSSEVTIRETNGEDEGILSRIASMKDGTNLHAFLARIITKDTKGQDAALTAADISAWPSSNIFYLVFKQRLINIGTTLKFQEECSSCNDKVLHTFEQDLTELDVFKPYPNKTTRVLQFSTSRGKTLRYKILTGDLTKKQLDIPMDALDKNTKILTRELEIHEQGNWTLVKYFGSYSGKEMREIREHIEINDPEFNPELKYNCPKCNAKGISSILNISSFYWPEEVI